MKGTGTTKIILTGRLGQIFGKEWNLHVKSPAEALRAIDVNCGGELLKYLRDEGSKKYYKIGLAHKENLLSKEELSQPTGKNDIYILPTVKGKSSGIGKIIAGVVLAVVAAAVIYFSGGTLSPFVLNAIGAVSYVADALVLGGIVQLLTPVPNFNANSLTVGDSRGSSSLFEGNATATSQGGAVGIVYGRALVSPMPVSISFNNTDQVNTSDVSSTTYDTSTGPGNVIEYQPVNGDN